MIEKKTYVILADGVPAEVTIRSDPNEFVPLYLVGYPKVEPATHAVLESVREKLIADLDLRPTQVLDSADILQLKDKYFKKSQELIAHELPNLSVEKNTILAGILLQSSLGLGSMEILLHDQDLEEIVVNGPKESIWVYHRKMGWLKTNITIATDTEIYNYASMIGRRVGMQITYLKPLMDAYMTTGDRANATLFPISTKGNTMTIRKFARRPWTITDFISAGVISAEVASFLWLAMQYEMNIIIAGGTASGKTSLLNVLAYFLPPNHRVISIEDTREIQMPDFLHWVPLTTRPPNPEGRGEVTMLELMINALRMRPDRILVGEIRRAKEAEVLFEAIHTGHSVYATLHANTAEEAVRRLTNPPINIPPSLLGALELVVVMHRDRRKEIRRVIQVAEVLSKEFSNQIEVNTVFGWSPSKDQFIELEPSKRVVSEIQMFTGMTNDDLVQNLKEKATILNWLVKKQIIDINKVGEVVSTYYTDPEKILKMVKG